VKKKRRSYREKSKQVQTVVFILLVIGALIAFFPFYWALVSSLKTKSEFWDFPFPM
jgi:ABC-type glycerol-3-phosphate transport system permease component